MNLLPRLKPHHRRNFEKDDVTKANAAPIKKKRIELPIDYPLACETLTPRRELLEAQEISRMFK